MRAVHTRYGCFVCPGEAKPSTARGSLGCTRKFGGHVAYPFRLHSIMQRPLLPKASFGDETPLFPGMDGMRHSTLLEMDQNSEAHPWKATGQLRLLWLLSDKLQGQPHTTAHHPRSPSGDVLSARISHGSSLGGSGAVRLCGTRLRHAMAGGAYGASQFPSLMFNETWQVPLRSARGERTPGPQASDNALTLPSPSTPRVCGIQHLDHLTAGWQGPNGTSIIPSVRARGWLTMHFYPWRGGGSGGMRVQGHSSLVTTRLRLFLCLQSPKGEEELKNITLTALSELRI